MLSNWAHIVKPLHCLKLVNLRMNLISAIIMDIRNIAKIVFRLIVSVSVLLKPSYSHSMPQLPESDLSWKNVTVDSKNCGFCLFRDSHGLMWLGTNSGLYFMME